MLDPVVNWAICISLALLWTSAAWGKVRANSDFSSTLAAYQLLPVRWVPVVARLLPIMESIIAAGLLIPAGRLLAAQLSAGLLLIYGAAIAINLARGHGDINCGCHPGHDHPVSWFLVARNIVLGVLSLTPMLPLSGRHTGLFDVALALLATAFACTIYLVVMSIVLERDSTDREMD